MFVRNAIITLVIVVFLFVFLAYLINRLNKREHMRIGTILAIIVVLGLVCILIPYSWPFPISVKLSEYAELTSLKEFHVAESWHCVYHIPLMRGFMEEDLSEDSYWGIPIIEVVEGYPEFDFYKYTYLFSFERKVEKLSYYVWDNKGPGIVDLGTANKWGTAVLSEEIYKNKIFVYRLPRIAIDNIKGTKYED